MQRARHDHPGAEHQPADDGARQAAARGKLAHARDVERAQQDERLHGHHRRRERQQPDGELLAGFAPPEFDHRRAQAKARALREKAESKPDGSAPGGE